MFGKIKDAEVQIRRFVSTTRIFFIMLVGVSLFLLGKDYYLVSKIEEDIDGLLTKELLSRTLSFDVYQLVMSESHDITNRLMFSAYTSWALSFVLIIVTFCLCSYVIVLMVTLDARKKEINTLTKFRSDEHSAILKGVSHELNSPLSGIHLMADTMVQRFRKALSNLPVQTPCCIDCKGRKLLSTTVERLELISFTCATVRNILSSLSGYSSLVKQEQMAAIPVKNLLKKSLQYAKFLDEFKAVSSSGLEYVDLCPDHDIIVSVIPTDLLTAIQNIISNGLRAIAARQRAEPDLKPRLRLSIEHDAAFVTVEISDNGVGMSDSQLKKATELFYTTSEHGQGIGMFIIDRNFKRSNITYHILSVEGEGTVVTFRMGCEKILPYTRLQALIGRAVSVQNKDTNLSYHMRCVGVDVLEDRLDLKTNENMISTYHNNDEVVVTITGGGQSHLNSAASVVSVDKDTLKVQFDPYELRKVKEYADRIF